MGGSSGQFASNWSPFSSLKRPINVSTFCSSSGSGPWIQFRISTKTVALVATLPSFYAQPKGFARLLVCLVGSPHRSVPVSRCILRISPFGSCQNASSLITGSWGIAKFPIPPKFGPPFPYCCIGGIMGGRFIGGGPPISPIEGPPGGRIP